LELLMPEEIRHRAAIEDFRKQICYSLIVEWPVGK